MTGRGWLVLGAAYGFLGVVFGAFGAHALRGRLTGEMQAVWRTAVEYNFYHALALVAVAMWMQWRPVAGQSTAAWAFALGVPLFSGSLYLLALTQVRILGAITPLGGLSFLIGWAALAVAAWRA